MIVLTYRLSNKGHTEYTREFESDDAMTSWIVDNSSAKCRVIVIAVTRSGKSAATRLNNLFGMA